VKSFQKSLLFTFFNAESWGHAGSQRFVQDISTKYQCNKNIPVVQCDNTGGPTDCSQSCFASPAYSNINFNNIESIVELNQVGNLWSTNSAAYYVHVNDVSSTTGLVSRFQAAQRNNSYIQVLPAASDPSFYIGLPPSTSMAFLAKENINTIVLADFNNSFSNR